MNSEGPSMQECIYSRNRDIVTRKITGELFVVPVRGRLADMQRIFTMNPVAEYIWNSIDGKTSLGDIKKGIVSNFDVREETAASDMAEFISELLEADLIRE